ncbi:CrcB family protein [Luteimonas sp. SJ-92]|uniref:Fluoride-specific ion channel FluC n=1 Tax=Luteimonas salinisoli TaxID=2752307 RepID=A0A853JF22_9GAMM|nr:CrcB family protein [Luteimonas salinisoli]NZA27943.1 CrcB family protein [Luteimonas salinisoli]
MSDVSLLAALRVGLGSALGAAARWLLALALSPAASVPGFPWGTLTANATGAALIGAYAALAAPGGRFPASPGQRQFVMAGFCGGFTTFSLFNTEVLAAAQAGRLALAAGIVAVSVPLWLAGVWLGHALGRRIVTRGS